MLIAGPEQARYLASGVLLLCQQLRRDGYAIPPDLAALRDELTAAVSSRQQPPLFDPPRELPQPDAVTIADAAARLGVSQRTAERWVASNQLRTIKIGRRRLVPTSAIDDVLGGAA